MNGPLGSAAGLADPSLGTQPDHHYNHENQAAHSALNLPNNSGANVALDAGPSLSRPVEADGGSSAGRPPEPNTTNQTGHPGQGPNPDRAQPGKRESETGSAGQPTTAWKIESHFSYQDGSWRCKHSSCLLANAPHQADTGRRLMGVYKGSQSSPSTISRRAEQHTRKHWEADAAPPGGALSGGRKRKYTPKEDPRPRPSSTARARAAGGAEDETLAVAKVDVAVAALIGLGSASPAEDARAPISPDVDQPSSGPSTSRPESPPTPLVEPVPAGRALSHLASFPLAPVLSPDKLDRVTALQDAQAALTRQVASGELSFDRWRERTQVHEVELAFLMGRAPTRI